jgi:hypothetical protein
MRQQVVDLLNEPLKSPEDNDAGPGRGNKTSLYYNDVFPVENQGTSADYTIRRLKRDGTNQYTDRVLHCNTHVATEQQGVWY